MNSEDKIILNINDTNYETQVSAKFLRRKSWAPKDEKKLTAFIPGVIGPVYVTQGASVRQGDKLLVLEAMKMKNDIRADISGKIKAICVTTGQMVTKGQLLIEFE